MRKDINFFKANRVRERSELDRRKLAGPAVAAVCLFAVLAVYGGFKTGSLLLQMEIRTQKAAISAGKLRQAGSLYAQENAKLSALNRYARTAQAQVSAFSARPKLTSSVLSAVAKAMPQDVNVSALSYESSTVTLTCTCTDALSAANFVHALRQVSLLSNVSYDGVETQQAGAYRFTAVFQIRGQAAN